MGLQYFLFYPTLCVLAFSHCLFFFFLDYSCQRSNLQTFSKNEILLLFIFSFVFHLTYIYPYFCYFLIFCYLGFTVLYFKKMFLIWMLRSFKKYSDLCSYCCLSSQHPSSHTHILGQASLQSTHGYLIFLVVFHFILLILVPGMLLFLLR